MNLVVDGTNLAHRYWHASARDAARAGAGVLAAVARGAAQCNASHAVIAFDGHDASAARRHMYPEYKATRSTSREVDEAITAAQNALQAAGWTVFFQHGREADDVLAHLATPGTYLLTGDKDAWGLITEEVTVLRPGNPFDVIDAEYVRTKFGFEPSRYTVYTAAKGDTSDNISGLAGIGEVSAAKLARAFTLDELIADIETGGTRVKDILGSRAKGIVSDPSGAVTVLLRNTALMSALEVNGVTLGRVPGHTPTLENVAATAGEPAGDVNAQIAAVKGDWW